jgi:hypothetical protein
MAISRDYPHQTRPSKQTIGEILGYRIIPTKPLKYLRSKQDLKYIPPLFLDIRCIVFCEKFDNIRGMARLLEFFT